MFSIYLSQINFNFKEEFLILSIIVTFYSCVPPLLLHIQSYNLFDKLESLKEGWVMSREVCDIKFLESPFPHGSCRGRMVRFCCLSHRRNLDNYYQVIQVLKLLFLFEKTLGIVQKYNKG